MYALVAVWNIKAVTALEMYRRPRPMLYIYVHRRRTMADAYIYRYTSTESSRSITTTFSFELFSAHSFPDGSHVAFHYVAMAPYNIRIGLRSNFHSGKKKMDTPDQFLVLPCVCVCVCLRTIDPDVSPWRFRPLSMRHP